MHDQGYFVVLIWQIADLLRGPYPPPQYVRVMVPITVLRRFDCVLAPTKARVLAEYLELRGRYQGAALDALLNQAEIQHFHNHSTLDLDACPELLAEVQAIDRAVGRESLGDRNVVLERIGVPPREHKLRWKNPSTSYSVGSSLPRLRRPRGSEATEVKASSPILQYATMKRPRLLRTKTLTSKVRCSLTCPTPGCTAPRTKSGTRSTSTGTSTRTRRHARWKRSTLIQSEEAEIVRVLEEATK